MKKLIISTLLLGTIIGTIFVTNAEAEILNQNDLAEGISGERLVQGTKSFNERGLYRIDDAATGYHIYVVTTSTTTQIHAVPMKGQ